MGAPGLAFETWELISAEPGKRPPASAGGFSLPARLAGCAGAFQPRKDLNNPAVSEIRLESCLVPNSDERRLALRESASRVKLGRSLRSGMARQGRVLKCRLSDAVHGALHHALLRPIVVPGMLCYNRCGLLRPRESATCQEQTPPAEGRVHLLTPLYR